MKSPLVLVSKPPLLLYDKDVAAAVSKFAVTSATHEETTTVGDTHEEATTVGDAIAVVWVTKFVGVSKPPVGNCDDADAAKAVEEDHIRFFN